MNFSVVRKYGRVYVFLEVLYMEQLLSLESTDEVICLNQLHCLSKFCFVFIIRVYGLPSLLVGIMHYL